MRLNDCFYLRQLTCTFFTRKKTETPAEKTTVTKAEPMATDEANSAPAESTTAAGGEKGEEKKPAENGTEESTTDSADSPPKLFVGRLPLGTKDTQLKELFGTYGEVTHCDIVGKYGFVVSGHRHFF